MPKLFKKFRSKLTKKSSKKDIFRKNDTQPLIERSMTWTLSDDENADSSSSPSNDTSKPVTQLFSANKIKAQSLISSGFTFTEDEVRQNELNHMLQLFRKNREIALSKKANQLLQKKHAATMKELREKHDIEMTAKDLELSVTKTELTKAKNELSIVSSTLIQTQHQLFEQSNSSWLPW